MGSPCHTGRTSTARRLVIGFLLSILTVFTVFSQEKSIPLELSPGLVEKNGYFYLSLTIDNETANNILLEEPAFPSAIRLYWGPRIRTLSKDTNGIIEKYVEIKYRLRGVFTGWYLLESFKVSTKSFPKKNYVTEPVVVGIGFSRNGKVIIPPEPEWFPLFEKVYAGEAVPITLKVGKLENLSIISSLDITPPSKGLFEKVSSLGTIEIEKLGKESFYTIPAASYMFTPTTPGRMFIPEAAVRYESITEKAKGISLNVLPLPQEVREGGGVGTFSLESWTDKNELEMGGEVELHIKIEGEGNLNYLKLPSPLVKGGELVKMRENPVYDPNENGYTGYREEIFTYSPVSEGVIELTLSPYSWLDKNTDTVKTTKAKTYRVKVIPSNDEGGEQKAETALTLKNIEQMKSQKVREYYNNVKSYLWCIPGIVILVLCIVLGRLKILFVSILFLFLGAGVKDIDELSLTHMKSGISSYQNGDFLLASDNFIKALDTGPDNSVILYNTGLSYFKAGFTGKALYYLRRANYVSPADAQIRNAIDVIEEEAGFQNKAVLYTIHPDFFFLLLILFFNASCVGGAVYYLRRKGVWAIFLILLMFGTLGSAVGLVYSSVTRRATFGVALKSIPVKRIPGEKASSWFTIKEGTSVRLIYTSGDYFFVGTEFGLKGWIYNGDVNLINESRM